MKNAVILSQFHHLATLVHHIFKRKNDFFNILWGTYVHAQYVDGYGARGCRGNIEVPADSAESTGKGGAALSNACDEGSQQAAA